MSTSFGQKDATVEAPTAPATRGGRRRGRLTDEFADVHVYEPHRIGLPPLRSYFREAWRRREFALELARTKLRAQHFNTAFGQLWLLLNPLLLASIYFVLVDLLGSGNRGFDFFAHLLAGLFAYQLVSTAVNEGAKSVVQGGKLIQNTAFPRTLLPMSAIVTAVSRFVPTLAIYVPVHLAAGLPVGPELLWLIPLVAILMVFATGAAMFVAAAQVYFRDLASFLPYVVRIWLYASPVLYYYHEVPDRYQPILAINPLTPVLTSWSDVLDFGHAPGADFLLWGLAWAVVVCTLGTLFFISREREFAIRL